MASTFTDLGIEKMATGENAGTWGDKTNTNLEIVEKAVAGYVEKSIAGGAQTTTLTITDGDSTESTSIARHAVIKLTGSITGNQVVTVPDSIEKVFIVTNGTSGAFTVQFKTVSGTGITFGVSEKTTKLFYSDGTNIVDAGFSGGTDLDGKELILDADGDTSLTADTDDQIDIKIGGTDQIKLVDGAIVPVTDNDIDLGTASLEFKDAFFDGTVTADAFAGPLTGNVTGNVSGTAATVTTAAQSNITSLGTLTTLTVDNVITNGSTIGHTSDTDLITLADGVVTVAGELDAATGDFSGDVDVDGTLEADAITINGTAIASVLSPIAGGSGIVTTGALNSGSITSGFGTIDTGSSTITTTGLISGGSLDIDNVLINGTTIGHTDDTDLITLADGVVTVAGEISVTTLDIGGTNVTSDATELNLLDGKSATNLALLGKTEGTNFTNSLLVGHATTGTLNAAERNTGVGINALDALTSGDKNTSVGYNALSGNNTGFQNSAFGTHALQALSSGRSNTAIGMDAGTQINTGDYNTLLGEQAGFALSGNDSNYNLLLGYESGENITEGAGNVIIGSVDAGSATGDRQLLISGFDGSTTTTWISGDSDGDLTFAHDVILANDSFVQFGDAGENILGNGTDLTIASSNDLHLTATTDINIPANVGLTFGDDGEKIEGNGTDLTIASSNDLHLTATTDINIPANVGLTFGDDAEKIEGDGTNLTISGNDIILDAADNVVIDSDVGTIFKDGGTHFGTLSSSSGMSITCNTSDGDVLLRGNDGGSFITALTLDISAAGAATFNNAITSGAVITSGAGVVVADAGTIGSASDADAIAIGSDGDVTLTQDLELQHDGAVLSFGANDEVTLTHVHDDGLLLNTDMQLQFRDSAINIRSDADGDLDINADDEVEINSTLIDVNGNLDVSGTLAQAGVATFAVAANVAQVALSSSSNAIAWDASAAANAYHVTTENTTFSAPSNAVEGAFICVEINYNGSHTIAFNTVFEFAASTAPTTTDTDGKTDILVFRYNGAVWQEVGRTLNLSES